MTGRDVSPSVSAKIDLTAAANQLPMKSPMSTPKVPTATLGKKGTSRWADEEEDDDFLPPKKPIEAVTQGSQRPAPKVDLRPARPAPERPFIEHRRQPSIDRRSPPIVERRPQYEDSRRPPKPVAPIVSQEAIKVVTEMKQVMTGLAEDRKKLKQDEDARLEAERRARCEEKLKKLESKNKPPAPAVPEWRDAQPPSAAREDKRAAFNAERVTISSKLSARAPAFVPTPPLPEFPRNH